MRDPQVAAGVGRSGTLDTGGGPLPERAYWGEVTTGAPQSLASASCRKTRPLLGSWVPLEGRRSPTGRGLACSDALQRSRRQRRPEERRLQPVEHLEYRGPAQRLRGARGSPAEAERRFA